ncbi:DNA-binding protein [Saccharopolyspora erythraea D]|nr:DNA-binding protein [Saccharopolyspora erythraea D]
MINGGTGGAKVEEQKSVQRNLALQRQWYGEPLGDRVRRLVVAFRISQAQLADVLGISAPMLSQVMSGRRAKIGNPQVLARLVMLERKVLIPGVAAGDSEAMKHALEDVRNSQPSVGRDNLPVMQAAGEETAWPVLREVARPSELEAAASMIDGHYPALAGLLRRAANGDLT